MLQMLGTYRIEEKLADGGMGSVFLARAPDGNRVVLKVPLAQDRESAIALADEARTGARLRHPAIIETLDFFIDNGRSVLVVAHVDGPSLFDLRRGGPLSTAAIAEIGVQLAGALHAIHTVSNEAGKPLNMLHRDISPNNVLVDKQGQVRLIDLGIARSVERKQKATSAGMVKGTLRYLAPEILQGGDHSVATDVWALGLTLWEAAVARYAVPGDPLNTMRAAIDGTILALGPDEHVDRDLREVIGAFVCPVEKRVQNARAASAILTRLGQLHRGGRAVLAEAVVVAGAVAFEEERTDAFEVTLAGVPLPSAVELRSTTAEILRDEDVAGVFTTSTPRAQIAAATMQMPAARDVPGKPAVPTSEESDVWSARSSSQTMRPDVRPPHRAPGVPPLATAATVAQMRSVSSLPDTAPTMLALPRFASEDVSADARTIVQMPAAQMPAPIVAAPVSGLEPASVSGLERERTEPVPFVEEAGVVVEDIETAATIQMPAWTPPAVKRDLPKPSLFLPIVVVDDAGDES